MNPATEQFIKDAIAGGWKANTFKHHKPDFTMLVFQAVDEETGAIVMQLRFAEILLDPLAWQAVGETRGWEDLSGHFWVDPDWEENWHRFIIFLSKNKTIEEALSHL